MSFFEGAISKRRLSWQITWTLMLSLLKPLELFEGSSFLRRGGPHLICHDDAKDIQKNTSVNLWSTLVGLSFTNIWKCTSIIPVKYRKKFRVEKKLFCKHNFLMWRCAKELSDVTTRTRRKSLFYFGLPLISAFIYVSVHGWPILVILWQRGWETVEKIPSSHWH